MNKLYPVIGMSPGNSYFKDEEVRYLIEKVVQKFGHVAILIADIPAISTYIALGYPENRARRDKAIPQGNLLRNRVKRAVTQLGYPEDKVKIVNWESEVENNSDYQRCYSNVLKLYESNKKFRESANKTTREVLEGSKRDIPTIESATKTAVHYLLSEISFLEWAPQFLNASKVTYVYHKNWLVYEDYVAGKFDGNVRKYMDFFLLENPWETYQPAWGLEDEECSEKYKSSLERVKKTGILRVAFSNYPPALTYDHEYDNFSGIFYEIIIRVSRKNGWKIRWSEETGYGVVVDGLNNDRFDVFGSPIWPIPDRVKKATPSNSVYSSEVYAWTRKKTRQDGLNTNDSRVAIKENDIQEYLAEKLFPNARKVYVPQLDTIPELLKFVSEDKADFTFAEKAIVDIFNKGSKAQLVQGTKSPVEVFDNTFLFKKGDKTLVKIFNDEINVMKKDGTIKKLIEKYSPGKQMFLIN